MKKGSGAPCPYRIQPRSRAVEQTALAPPGAAEKDAMTTANMSDLNTMIGAPVSSTDGESLDKISPIYVDNGRTSPHGPR